MNTTLYVKKDRRYVPVSEFDDTYRDRFPLGATLTVAKPGSVSHRAVNPDFASMVAAGTYARDKMVSALVAASEAKPQEKVVTESQHKAWNDFKQAYGQDICYITYPSAMEIVDAGLDEMRKEAETMLQNPAVRAAYDQLMTVWQLTKDQTSTSI
jgi:hypothetical protein